MHKLILLALVLLAGCVARQAPQVGVFRDSRLPMWSIAQFDAARLAGTWKEAAGFQGADSRCRPGGLTIRQMEGGLYAEGRLCLGPSSVAIADRLVRSGPGRFRVGDSDWWVIWVDTDYRTVAMATPSGQFGFVLERTGNLSADRAAAAREIFDFNGYRTAAFNVY